MNTLQDSWTIYRQCIDTLFSRWTALTLALENWNRPTEQRRQLLETLQQVIIQAAQDEELCTELLETLFEETFDVLQVDVEDDSIEQVSCLLCDMWKDCLQGNMEKLNAFLKHRQLTSSYRSQEGESGETTLTVSSSSLQEEEKHSSSHSTIEENCMEEDGFQLVGRRRHR